MGLFSHTCTKCGAKIKKEATFCASCGAPAPGGMSRCGKCNGPVKSTDKFCGQCGADIQVYAPVQIIDNRWVRSAEEFAVRVEANDLEGWLKKGLIVEPGTQAVLIQRGRYMGTLPSGQYALEDFRSRLNNLNFKNPVAVILMSTTDMLIPLAFSQLRTKDAQSIDVRCQVVLTLSNPEHFAFRLMAGRERITVAELKETLVGEVHNVLQALINQMGIEELYGNLAFKIQVEERLQEALGWIVARNGLELLRLHFMDYAGEVYERLQQRRGEISLASREAEELVARAEITKRIQQTLTQKEMTKLKTTKDLEEFIRQKEHELGLKQIIRDHEMEELKRTFHAEREDHEMERRHILERLELEYTLALRKTKLEADAVQQEARLKQERQEFEYKQKMEWERAEQQKAMALAEARKIAEIQEIEDQQDFREAERALELLQQMKEIKLQEEKARRILNQEDRLLDAKIRERELEARSRASIEALISTASPEQAKILAELESIRLHRNLTEEQMITLMTKLLVETRAEMTGKGVQGREERV